MHLLKEYYPASNINEKMIEELIKNKKQHFEETWPQQMRAYKNTQSFLDNRFTLNTRTKLINFRLQWKLRLTNLGQRTRLRK